MQYGMELFTYKRGAKSKKNSAKNKNKNMDINIGVYFILAFLISRVSFFNLLSPFGVAFVMVFIFAKNKKHLISLGLGSVLGYFSSVIHFSESPAYIIVIMTIVLVSYLTKEQNNKRMLLLISILAFLEFLFFDGVFYSKGFILSLINSSIKIASIIPVYYVLSYSIKCFKNYKTKHLYKNEEIIAMSFFLSLAIAGTLGFSIYSVSITNILALFLVLTISYVKGASVGASSGVALGSVLGLSYTNIFPYISVLSLSSLIGGAFKEGGKYLTCASFIVTFSVIKIYSNLSINFKIIEVLISSLIFILLSDKIYDKLSINLDYTKKKDFINEMYIDKIKSVFSDKLENYSDVLFKISDTLNDLVGNERLKLNTKSSALIEDLAQRVCEDCSMKSICWKRESYYTYELFRELIQNYQENKAVIPDELNEKCINRTKLIEVTEDIVNNFIVSEMWENRLNEGREIIASQINNIAYSVEEISKEISSNIKFDSEREEIIKKLLIKDKLEFSEVFCFVDDSERLEVDIKIKSCLGKQICVKKILPLINESLNKSMTLLESKCNIDKEGYCLIKYRELPKFHIISFSNSISKDGEACCGDNLTYEKLEDGTYVILLCDGMGTGPQASKESLVSVELIKEITKCGFSKTTAINTVNSVMTLKFYKDEKFTTIDLVSVDLFSGTADFMKVGAVASFVKGKYGVDIVYSKTLPIGVLDKADIDITRKKLRNGDLIITVSDGILDYNNESAGSFDWLFDFLKDTDILDPDKLSCEILNKAKELRNNKINDDMSVIVSKIYEMY
ncbi:MAG: stage II sporulation protein E [Clostridiaceae bacterium]